MDRSASSKLHIAMFPWFAVGHLTPFLHLSNEIAQRGHKISYLLPRKAHIQLQSQNQHPDLITFYPLAVPPVAGLPSGTETASDIPISQTGLLATAMDHMRGEVEEIFRSLRPDFVFYDLAHWITELGSSIGFKTVCYNVVSAASLAIALVPARVVPKDRKVTVDELAVPPKGYPSSSVVLRPHEARSLLFISSEFGAGGVTFYERVIAAMKNCDAIGIRTCRETEGSLCDYMGTQYNKPVLLTGPILPEPSKAQLDDRWSDWLNKFPPKSVILCTFGSQIVLEKGQFHELVLGLESTALPFLAAVRTSAGEEALPEGFENRVGERGVVYGGWVQQPLILNHPSVGCFVSHCGFGSMWESLMSDCQIVVVPHLGDQILNARLLAEEMKVAVEVERDEKGWFSRERLGGAIKTVMERESEAGEVVRKNHAKWKEIMVKPGFMSNYVENFIEKLHEL